MHRVLRRPWRMGVVLWGSAHASAPSRAPVVAATAFRGFSSDVLHDYRDFKLNPSPLLARSICQDYLKLPSVHTSEEKRNILHYLAATLAVDPEVVSNLLEHRGRLHAPTIEKIRQACTPPFANFLEDLIRQDVRVAIPFLVALRNDLLQWKQYADTDLSSLDGYLRTLLSNWFLLLKFERLAYDTSPAALIEKVARLEAVHPMQSLQDLKDRLGPGRRVFCLLSDLLPGDPLVVLYVSLQSGHIPASMAEIYEPATTGTADVACFYSISNGQPGLAGLGLGETLIHRAVDVLRAEGLERFCTLSPLPNFRSWLEHSLQATDAFTPTPGLLSADDLEALAASLSCPAEDVQSQLLYLLQNEGPDLLDIPGMERILRRLAARYLAVEKHRRHPFDPVARFHCGNGARMLALRYRADLSRKRWKQSYGLMVSYLYELDELETRRSSYPQEIIVDESIEELLPKGFDGR